MQEMVAHGVNGIVEELCNILFRFALQAGYDFLK